MRAWTTFKKALSIIGILFIMYMVVGFFWWHYVVNSTVESENMEQITDPLEPVFVFFQPCTDFYTWAYTSFLGEVNPELSHDIDEAYGTVAPFEGGGGTYSNPYFDIQYTCEAPWNILGYEQIGEIKSPVLRQDMRATLGDNYITVNLTLRKATRKASESDFQRQLDSVKQTAEELGGTAELTETPWSVGDNQFRSVRVRNSFSDGGWSFEHHAFCSRNGISMFIDIYNAPDDRSIDDAMSHFQPLAAPEGA